MIQELTESKNQLLAQMQSCLNKCEKLVLENQTYRERLHQHQIDETLLGQKLAEFKNAIIKINTKVQIYHVIKIGLISNSRMDITFGQDKENNYVMRIDDEDRKTIFDEFLNKRNLRNRSNIKYNFLSLFSKKEAFKQIIFENCTFNKDNIINMFDTNLRENLSYRSNSRETLKILFDTNIFCFLLLGDILLSYSDLV